MTLSYNYLLSSDSQGIITFEPFQLGKYSTYYINAIASSKSHSTQTQKTFKVILSDIFVSIKGGDQIIEINQQSKLEAVVFNPNNQTGVNDFTHYQAIWRCINIVTNLECNNFSYSNFQAQISTQQHQLFMTLYVIIQVFTKSNQLVCQDNITIHIIENQISQIYLTGNQYEVNTPMNIQDEVNVSMHYLNQQSIDVDNLSYYSQYVSCTYQYNSVQFYYPNMSIILKNFGDTNQNKFKVMIYNPSQSSPSISTLKIRINIPPKQCKLSIFPRGSKFTIHINSCISQSHPLQYKFLYYATNDVYIQDSQNGLISDGIQLTDFQINPFLISYLYGQNTSMIVGVIKDSSNGLSNTTLSLANYRTIDSTFLLYMLQDSSQNLQKNIMFLMIYLQINNQILTSEYFNRVYEITTKFNQTDQMTLYIQQQLASSSTLTSDSIVSQLTIMNFQINDISEQLIQVQNQWSQNSFNKNYQIQLREIYQRLIQFPKKQASFIVNLNQFKIEDYQMCLLKTVSKITDIFSSLVKVNQNSLSVNTPQFNMTAQSFSTLKVNQNFNLQIVNQTNQTVSFKNHTFGINPYQNQSDFINPIQAPLIIPNLTNANKVQITPANPVPINFELIDNVEVSCASKMQGFWSMDVCKLVKSETNIKCLCQTLSPVTIAQALEFVIGQYASLFSRTITRKISQFAYGLSLFTYIIVVFVFLYFVSMYVLFRKDNIDEAKVQPLDDLYLKKSEEDRYKIISPPPEFDVAVSMKVIMVGDQTKDLLYSKISIIGQVKGTEITRTQGFKLFLQNSHQLFELYYRYDNQQPRILRLSILFLQLVGQICIFVLFGKNLTISIIIALSIFQTTYGVLFQLILSQMIKSKNQYARGVGIVTAGLLTGFNTYLIIAAMALYSSNYDSNLAAYHIWPHSVQICFFRIFYSNQESICLFQKPVIKANFMQIYPKIRKYMI